MRSAKLVVFDQKKAADGRIRTGDLILTKDRTRTGTYDLQGLLILREKFTVLYGLEGRSGTLSRNAIPFDSDKSRKGSTVTRM